MGTKAQFIQEIIDLIVDTGSCKAILAKKKSLSKYSSKESWRRYEQHKQDWYLWETFYPGQSIFRKRKRSTLKMLSVIVRA